MTGRWAPIAAGLVLEAGWLVVASASLPLSESRGFRDAFARAAPAWTDGLDALRRTASDLLGLLGGPREPTQAAAVLLVGALVLTVVAYLVGLAAPPGRPGWIVGLSLVFQVTLLAMPGLLSTDLLTYATYGRLAGVYGQNPYLAAPGAVASDPLVQWLDTRPEHASPYGPVWTLLSVGLAWLTAGLAPLAQALSYRLLGSLAHLAGMAAVWRLGRDPRGLLLFAWNPLLLLENVGSGHNDGLMMTLALASLLMLATRAGLDLPGLPAHARLDPPAQPAPTRFDRSAVPARARLDRPILRARARRGWPALEARACFGVLLLGVASLVKYVPALLLVYLGTCLARTRPRLAAALAGLVLVLALLLWLPWLDPRQPSVLLASLSAGGERYVNALVDLPTGWIATHLVDRSGQDVAAAEAAVRAWPRAVVRVLFVLYVMLEARRLWILAPGTRSAERQQTAVIQAALRGYLVALLLVVTQVLAWYFTWPVALAAALGWRSTLARVAVAYSIVYLPVFYAIHEDLVPNPAPLLLGYALLPLLIVALARISRAALVERSRRRVSLEPAPAPRNAEGGTRSA